MATRLSDAAARKIMLAAGLKPVTPYVSSSSPWKSICIKCKREVAPTFNNVQQGRGSCRYCAGNATKLEDAIEAISRAHLVPLEPFPGAANQWKCKCLNCGEIVTPRLKGINRGQGGCKYCARKKAGASKRIDESEAIKIMNSVKLTPLEPYKTSNNPWKSSCNKCKKIVSPTLSTVKSRGSGCIYCAGRSIDENDAVALFKKNKLESLEPYQGNKHPWRSIHIPCGKEVAPTLQAIKRGQGPCKYCAHKAVHPDDARAIFLVNNLKPLEEYSGDSKRPWRSIHIPCGNEVSPSFNIIQRKESIGCHFCSDQFVDPTEAYQFFLDKGFQPLIPYPGSNKPWKSIHLVCGTEARPSYGKIKSGRTGCAVCSNVVKISQERAFKFFRENDLEPTEKFKGPNLPWKSIHTKCGRKVSPRWASVQQGQGGCAYCSGNKVDLKDIRKILKENNLKLLEPLINASKKLKCIHTVCGNEVSITYSNLRIGNGPCLICSKNMVTEKEALSLLKKNNYEPLMDFPGGSKPWVCIHSTCGTKVEVHAAYLRRGGIGCSFCAGTKPIKSADAIKFFKSRGFKPIGPFKNAKTPMKSIHLVCGKEVSPSWASLRVGQGCKYCSTANVNLLAPAYLYLITNSELNAHKIGISGHGATANRLERHQKLGWKKYAVLDLDTGEEAYEIEEQILEWLRLDLSLQKYLVSEQMPQGGHTETVDASEVELATIWAKVEELSKK